jgi:hypothetical protein
VTIVLIISLLDIYVIDTSMRSTEDSFLFTTFTLVVNLVVFVRYLVIVRASVSKQVHAASHVSSTRGLMAPRGPLISEVIGRTPLRSGWCAAVC